MSFNFTRLLAAAALLSLCALVGTSLIVLNPGLFWDDWVWRFTSNEEFIRLGQELGLWWIGRLSIAIWTLQDPVLAMRLTSLIGWLAGGTAIALLLVRLKIATQSESLLWMALYSACHLGMIRFIPSVAMYSVYIAAFWIAWALNVYYPRQTWSRLTVVVLLLFAFHLNSMLVLYGVMLVWLIWEQYSSPAVANSAGADTQFPEESRHATPAPPQLSVQSRIFQAGLAAFRANSLVFLSPVIFGLLIKLPSAALVKTSQEPVNFYSRYNFFNPLDLLMSLPRAILYVPQAVGQYISLPRTGFGYAAAIGLFVTALILMTLAVDAAQRPRARRAFIQLAAGLFLILCGVFPYFVVGKPPVLTDFYEGRHILVAIPGVCLVFVALAGIVASMLPARSPDWVVAGVRNAIVAMVIALSLTQAMSFSLMLLVDWLRQQTIVEYVRDNRDKIDGFGLVIFEDLTSRVRTNERYIWNYEYTGMLLSATGQQTRLGLSIHEYVTSSVSSPLFFNQSYLRRYNARLFDIKKPALILTIENGEDLLALTARKVLVILGDHWAKRPIRYSDLKLIKIKPSLELRESDQRMAALRKVSQALERYRDENGYYPQTVLKQPPVLTPFGRLLAHPLGGSEKPEVPLTIWHELIVPKFIEPAEVNIDCGRFDEIACGLLYISNGIDYKLLLKKPPQDMAYARQALGKSIDPKRNLIGIWTEDARNW